MSKYPYQNPSLSIDKRIDDLLARMTLKQKVRQITSLPVINKIRPEQLQDGIGELILSKTDGDNNPATFAQGLREAQDICIKSNPWGIPAIFRCEALTGALVSGCAVFPSSLAIGSSFEPEMLTEMTNYIRLQMLDLGIREALSPVFDLARDFRWGRTNEDYSSDPTLVAEMGVAFVKGIQGEDLKYGIAATAKHLLGYSISENGINTTRVQTDWDDLRENFSKPFEAAIRLANIRCAMNCYSEINGDLVCNSKAVLSDLLRDDLGFSGLVVSDYTSIERLVDSAKTAENYTEAGIKCLKAGLDVELPQEHCYGPNLVEAVKNGELEEKYVDTACRRMLHLKFELGLFEKPYGEYQPLDNTKPHQLSADISLKAMILVKNEGVLPVTDHSKKIVVIGPNGNGLRILNGSYTQPADFEMMLYMINQIKAAMPGFDLTKAADAKKKEEKGQEAKKSNLADLKVGCPVSKPNPEDLQELIESSTRKMAPGSKTVFEALKEIYPNTAYCRGCYLNNNEKDDINAAALAAEKADVAVLVLGGKNGWGADCTSGEGLDNMDIRLTGRQEELALAVLKANSNTVVVHIDSHPLVSPSIYEKAGAVIECFFPGPFGGIAVAKTISGENNPGGRLCVDVPRHVGQTPLYYYQHNGSRSDLKVINTTYDGYVDGKASAQYPFGYGLSYTQFSYAKPELNAKTGQDKIPVLTASINVKNTGKVTGDEVVMLFGQNEFASKVRPQKELIGFKRVTLKPGEEKRVSLTFRLDQLSFPIENEKWVLEKGKFNFAFCKNADEPLFSLEYNMEQDLVIDHTRRGFYAQAVVKSL